VKFDFDLYLQTLLLQLLNYLPKIVGALALLFIGLWIIKQINKMLASFFQKRSYEPTLESFLESLLSIGLKIFLIISVAGILGFQTASLVTILGAAGLAVGLALQGSLANFAGGVLILIFKPYRVGDLVNLLGNLGHVKQIQIFNTIIVTLDNKTVILPNGAVMNSPIVNLSEAGNLLVDLRITLPFDCNFVKARQVLLDVMKANPNVLLTITPTVDIMEINGAGDLILAVRSNALWEKYWDAYFYNYEHIHKALLAEVIHPPKPDRFIHMVTDTNNPITH
jgi:small conductance mechanosensitive channel